MKVFGFVIVVLGLAIAYIGITGSQHRVMDIIKGIHLGSAGTGSAGPVNKGGAGLGTAGPVNAQTTNQNVNQGTGGKP